MGSARQLFYDTQFSSIWWWKASVCSLQLRCVWDAAEDRLFVWHFLTMLSSCLCHADGWLVICIHVYITSMEDSNLMGNETDRISNVLKLRNFKKSRFYWTVIVCYCLWSANYWNFRAWLSRCLMTVTQSLLCWLISPVWLANGMNTTSRMTARNTWLILGTKIFVTFIWLIVQIDTSSGISLYNSYLFSLELSVLITWEME